MSIGLDPPSANPRLDQLQSRWNQFLGLWGKNPVFAGRFFGDIIDQVDVPSANAWVPGELSRLPASSPLQSLRYILPFATPGPVTQDPASVTLSQHGFGIADGVFFRQQGQTRKGARVSPRTVRSQAQADANATCKQLADALAFVDPGTGQPELVLPDSEIVFVFLDVEPQTALHPQYWLGWAETISSFAVTKMTSSGTVALVQPFRPCLYCVVREDPIDPAFDFPNDKPGPWPEIMRAFRETGFISERIRGKHACHAIATPWPFVVFDQAGAVAATEAEVQAKFPKYGPLQQPVGADATVVNWQYQINIGMDADGNLFDATAPPAGHVPVFQIDLDITTTDLYQARPITDYFLRRT